MVCFTATTGITRTEQKIQATKHDKTVTDNPELEELPDLTSLPKLRILGIENTALPAELRAMELRERLVYFRTHPPA